MIGSSTDTDMTQAKSYCIIPYLLIVMIPLVIKVIVRGSIPVPLSMLLYTSPRINHSRCTILYRTWYSESFLNNARILSIAALKKVFLKIGDKNS